MADHDTKRAAQEPTSANHRGGQLTGGTDIETLDGNARDREMGRDASPLGDLGGGQRTWTPPDGEQGISNRPDDAGTTDQESRIMAQDTKKQGDGQKQGGQQSGQREGGGSQQGFGQQQGGQQGGQRREQGDNDKAQGGQGDRGQQGGGGQQGDSQTSGKPGGNKQGGSGGSQNQGDSGNKGDGQSSGKGGDRNS